MKKIQYSIIASIVCASSLAHAETVEEMLQAVNQIRSQAQVCGGQRQPATHALKANPALQIAAQKHADDMAQNGYFNHNSQDGRSPFDRIRAEGYRIRAAAENISYGRNNVHAALNGWLNSPSHCRNLMSGAYNETGIAYNGVYWVQVFGTAQ